MPCDVTWLYETIFCSFVQLSRNGRVPISLMMILGVQFREPWNVISVHVFITISLTLWTQIVIVKNKVIVSCWCHVFETSLFKPDSDSDAKTGFWLHIQLHFWNLYNCSKFGYFRNFKLSSKIFCPSIKSCAIIWWVDNLLINLEILVSVSIWTFVSEFFSSRILSVTRPI